MGEYILVAGRHVKLGTCQDLYYASYAAVRRMVTGGRVIGGEVKCSGAAFFRLATGYTERDLDGLAQAITQALDWPVRCAIEGRGVCVEVMAHDVTGT